MPVDLDAIKARLAAATPGPWDTDGTTVWAEFVVPDPGDRSGQTPMRDRELVADSGGADAELIAHAPEDLAALLAEIERLRVAAEEARDVADQYDRDVADLNAENKRLRAVAEALESERGNRTSGSLIGLHSVAPLALAALDAWRGGDTDE